MIQKKNLTNLCLLLLLNLALLLPAVFNRPFYTKGEPREAAVVLEIVESGNWILPLRYGEIPSKPIFSHWLGAGFSHLAGEVNEAMVRLPSALLSILVVLALYLFIAKRVSPGIGLLSSFFLTGCLEWHRASATCRVDMTLAAFMFFAFIGIYRWEEKKFEGYPFWTVLFLAAAFLTKGPIGVMLPGLVYLVYGLSSPVELKRLIWKGVLLFTPAIVLSLCWYYLAWIKGGEDFFNVVAAENFARFTGNMPGNRGSHPHSALYLLTTVVFGMLPWTVVIIPALLKRIPGFKISRIKLSSFTSLPVVYQFSWITLTVIIGFYLIPESKRSVYLLPAYPFICFLAASLVSRFSECIRAWKIWAVFLSVIAIVLPVLLLVASSSMFSVEKYFTKEKDLIQIEHFRLVLEEAFQGFFSVEAFLVYLLTGGSIYLLIRLSRMGAERIVQSSLMLFFLLVFILNQTLLPEITRSLSARDFSWRVRNRIGDTECFYSTGMSTQGVNFYTGNSLKKLSSISELSSGCYLVARKDHLDNFRVAYPQVDIVVEFESKRGVTKANQKLLLISVKGVTSEGIDES